MYATLGPVVHAYASTRLRFRQDGFRETTHATAVTSYLAGRPRWCGALFSSTNVTSVVLH